MGEDGEAAPFPSFVFNLFSKPVVWRVIVIKLLPGTAGRFIDMEVVL